MSGRDFDYFDIFSFFFSFFKMAHYKKKCLANLFERWGNMETKPRIMFEREINVFISCSVKGVGFFVLND